MLVASCVPAARPAVTTRAATSAVNQVGGNGSAPKDGVNLSSGLHAGKVLLLVVGAFSALLVLLLVLEGP